MSVCAAAAPALMPGAGFHVCCRDLGHAGMHESIGGARWSRIFDARGRVVPELRPLPFVPSTIADFDLAGSCAELPSPPRDPLGVAIKAMWALYAPELGPWRPFLGVQRYAAFVVAPEPEAKVYAPTHGGYPEAEPRRWHSEFGIKNPYLLPYALAVAARLRRARKLL